MIWCRIESFLWQIESECWEAIFFPPSGFSSLSWLWQPLFRLLGMAAIKHNTTKYFLQASLLSIGYRWPDLGERWFNPEPGPSKIGGRKSHCIICFKGEFCGGMLHSGRLEVPDTVLISHGCSSKWAIAFKTPPAVYSSCLCLLPPPLLSKAVSDLRVFHFLSEVLWCLTITHFIYLNIGIKDD